MFSKFQNEIRFSARMETVKVTNKRFEKTFKILKFLTDCHSVLFLIPNELTDYRFARKHQDVRIYSVTSFGYNILNKTDHVNGYLQSADVTVDT